MQRARTAITAAMTLLIAACAGSPAHHSANYDADNDDFDAQKVEAVMLWAHDHGAKEIWVNYPTKYRPRDVANTSSNPAGQ